jgi:hypothetical protein
VNAPGRLRLVEEKPAQSRPLRDRVLGGVVLAAVAWLLTSVVLGFAGVHGWWLANDREEEALHLAALLVVVVTWVWRRVRRVDASAP